MRQSGKVAFICWQDLRKEQTILINTKKRKHKAKPTALLAIANEKW